MKYINTRRKDPQQPEKIGVLITNLGTPDAPERGALRRYLKDASASPDAFASMAFAELIRSGNEQGLLRSDWGRWKAYRQARTDSSHTYDEKKAIAVYAIAAEFVEEARFLYHKLMERSALP